MPNVWNELNVFEITEQRLADQTRAIRLNGWLSEIELEEIQRNAENGHSEVDIRVTSDDNDSTQRIELETKEETVEYEAVVDTDNSAGNE